MQRLRWLGIDSMEENKISNQIYGKECDCKLDHDRDFKCHCSWRKKITLGEQNSFHSLRSVTKAGIKRLRVVDYNDFS